MYPDDCIQSAIADPSRWWVKQSDSQICKGSLIHAFVPYIDETPYTFEPVGRTDPRSHTTAEIKVAPLAVNQPLKQTQLPVAAMTLHHGEIWAAYKAKRRPCLVLGSVSVPAVDKSLMRGKPNRSTAPTMLIAPYYGATDDGSRAGYTSAFVERVRHCEYPQFMWDSLPIPGGTAESIMRIDHLQPIGRHYKSYNLLGYKLSEEALTVIDEIITWYLWGGVPKNGTIASYRELIEEVINPSG